MKICRLLKNQSGFTLVQAIFILVVLALLGVVMVRLIGIQSSTSVMALQQARAYQAARGGLEWAAARAAAGSDCNGNMTFGDFQVAVTCISQNFTEGTLPEYSSYKINATASFSNFGTADYVSRRAEMKVIFP